MRRKIFRDIIVGNRSTAHVTNDDKDEISNQIPSFDDDI